MIRINLAKGFRLLPVGLPGKAGLAKLILGSAIETTDITISDSAASKYTIPSLMEPIGFHLLIDGIYEPEIQDIILRNLQPRSIFLDVGANIGAVTIPAAHKVGPDGKVLAIEASPTVFPYLDKNVKQNQLQNVELFNVAASNTITEIPFYEAPKEKYGMGSLGAQFGAKPVFIPGLPMDSVLADQQIEHVDVIKIDVEGFELFVFQGLQNLLRKANSPLIVFEFCDWAEARLPGGKAGDAQQFLMDTGYSIWLLEDFVGRRAPLSQPVTAGFHTIVAQKR